MKYIFLVLLFLFLKHTVGCGQEVEHNYLVEPQATNCDSLILNDINTTLSIEKIRSTKFRFDQTFRLTRKSGLQVGEYYSCDNLSGFMMIKYNGSTYLYSEVKKQIWDQMISSSDPEGFYLENKSHLVEW